MSRAAKPGHGTIEQPNASSTSGSPDSQLNPGDRRVLALGEIPTAPSASASPTPSLGPLSTFQSHAGLARHSRIEHRGAPAETGIGGRDRGSQQPGPGRSSAGNIAGNQEGPGVAVEADRKSRNAIQGPRRRWFQARKSTRHGTE